jgi:BRCA1-associated protein
MVLIRFRDAADASEFKVMYNGRPYHDTKDSEVCHVVSISSIKLKSSSTPPFTFPYPTDIEAKSTDVVELPTCPICLERLDVKISGLVQILCQHGYHCECLLRWGDSR